MRTGLADHLAFQPLYFVADSLEAVAAELEALDLAGLKALAGPL